MLFTNPTNSSVVLDDLTFTWPDGTPVLDHLTATFGAVRTGLTGANGTGKSTPLRTIAGELSPTSGHLSVPGSGEPDAVGYLPQRLTLDTDATVAALAAAGLDGVELTRRVGTLSGGQTMLTALVGLRLQPHEIVLLDRLKISARVCLS